MRRAGASVALAAGAVLALGTTALAAVPADRHPHDEAEVPPGLERFYDQDVAWYPCVAEGGMTAGEGAGFQCATVEVPLDYEDPEGRTIQIALKKHEATGPRREGSLLLNPGGPGGSGIGVVERLARPDAGPVSAEVAAAYDVIGFDPRGVGASTAIRCEPPAGADGAETDQQGPQDAPGDSDSRDSTGSPVPNPSIGEPMPDLPEDAAEPGGPGAPLTFADLVALVQQQVALTAAQCAQYTQPVELLDHVDSVSVVRDMDVMRALSGEHDLDYLGYSYGTYLGALYAELFPQNTGRLVLDGAMDPSLSLAERSRDQALSFEASRRAYVESCLATPGCPLSGDADTASAQLDAFIDGLAASPIPTADPAAPLTGRQVEDAILPVLYNSALSPALTEALRQAMTQGDGSMLARLASFSSQVKGDHAWMAVTCLDYPVEGDASSWEWDYRRDKADAPHYGGSLTDAMCQAWGHNGTRAPQEIHAEGAAPILVIGTTGDPATPYSWAVSLADQLDSGELLTWEGQGHTAYTRAGDCVSNAVDAYLLTGQMPQDDLVCTGKE